MMNESFWEKLPEDIQQQINRAMNDTTSWLWDKSKEMNETQLHDIEKNSNIEIYTLSEKERMEWMEEMTSIYPEFESTIGKDLLDKMERIRDKYIE